MDRRVDAVSDAIDWRADGSGSGRRRQGDRRNAERGNRGVPRLAPRPGTAARRTGAAARRGTARREGRSGHAGDDRGGQDSVRERRRSAGDDRHLRLCRRAVAPAVRADDRHRTAGAPDDGDMASARRRRGDFGVQFSGRGVGVERGAGAGVRQQRGVETVGKDSARRIGDAGDLRSRGGAVRRCAAPGCASC